MVKTNDLLAMIGVFVLTIDAIIGIDYAKLGGSRDSFYNKKSEIYAQLSAKKNMKQLTEAQFKEATIQAVHCRACIADAVMIIQDKKFNPKTDKMKALNYIITAKGYVEKMKALGIPFDREQDDIKAIEKALYNM